MNDSPAPQWIWEEVEVWPSIVGYEIPLDHPSVVWSLTSPETWNYRFLSADEYQLEYGTPNPFLSAYVLQWYDEEFFSQPAARMIVPTGFNERFEASEYEPFANGFSFLSELSPVDGPYANLWVDFFPQHRRPAPARRGDCRRRAALPGDPRGARPRGDGPGLPRRGGVAQAPRPPAVRSGCRAES